MPHTSISNVQNVRRNVRVVSGNGKWSARTKSIESKNK